VSPTAVLIGPPAAGKTRIGKATAKMLGVPFTDVDARIVEKHGSIPLIFAEHGEAQFRAWERVEVAHALTEDGVVSLGGGAVEDEQTQKDLENLTVVLVTVSAEAVADRLDNDKRPLLNGIDSWRALVARRQDIYDELATITIDTSTGPMDQHAERLAEMLRVIA
jgi:shikimate kinase